MERNSICEISGRGGMGVSLLAISIVLLLVAYAGNAAGVTVQTEPSTVDLENALITGANGIFNEGVCSGLSLSDIRYTGTLEASGTFTGGLSSGIGIDTGIILTNGLAKNAEGSAGSNSAPNISGIGSGLRDTDLESLIPGLSTTDATVLEFDLQTATGNFFISFVFASDEYKEKVGTTFNDIFAFLYREKGTGGPFKNIALIPLTTIPVAINNINHVNNSSFYKNNDFLEFFPSTAPFSHEYDGFTHVITAYALGLDPARRYEIKLAIADGDDNLIDSAMFMKAGGLCDTPQFITIITTDLPSQVVGTSYTATIVADGSSSVPYTWDIIDISLSSGLPDDILSGNLPSISANSDKTAVFTWVLPAIAEGEHIDITIQAMDQDGNTALAVFRYTDPEAQDTSVNARGGGDGDGGGCFIATAAYGSYLDHHVKTLRDFRDNYLITNTPGKAFVSLYYNTSPPVADIIREHDTLRAAARIVLTPLVYSVQYPEIFLLTLGLVISPFVYRRVRKGK